MIISAITPQKHRPNRVSVFVDGAFAFGMEASDAERCGLHEKQSLTRERLDELLNEVLFTRARDAALRYLSLRPRTLRETVKRLKEDEYPPIIIKRVLTLMVKYRYINDRQYAKDYIESRTRAHYGLYRIKQELKARGVRDEVITHELEQTDIDEAAVIAELIRGSRKELKPDALRRRGFSGDGIREAFKLIKEESDEG